jgi:hypothetical protein
VWVGGGGGVPTANDSNSWQVDLSMLLRSVFQSATEGGSVPWLGSPHAGSRRCESLQYEHTSQVNLAGRHIYQITRSTTTHCSAPLPPSGRHVPCKERKPEEVNVNHSDRHHTPLDARSALSRKFQQYNKGCRLQPKGGLLS